MLVFYGFVCKYKRKWHCCGTGFGAARRRAFFVWTRRLYFYFKIFTFTFKIFEAHDVKFLSREWQPEPTRFQKPVATLVVGNLNMFKIMLVPFLTFWTFNFKYRSFYIWDSGFGPKMPFFMNIRCLFSCQLVRVKNY